MWGIFISYTPKFFASLKAEMANHRIIAYWNLHRMPILMGFLGGIFYLILGYYLEREDTLRLFSLYGALFFLCYKVLQLEKFNFRFLLVLGLLFRLILLLSLPNLSNDFYRFLWDGHLQLEGLSPYLHKPAELIGQHDLGITHTNQLYAGMGELSQENFSNYPPLNQWMFLLSVLLGGKTFIGGVLIMRLLIIGGDLMILWIGRKILKLMNRSPHLIFWYFLNPLVIIELSGNLHFEGIMLAFFLTALYFLRRGKWLGATVFYAASISLKLIPLVGLPLVIPYLGWKRGIAMVTVTTTLAALSFIPFLEGDWAGNYLNTVGLWFSNFEFNAGIYNLVKVIAVSAGVKPWILIGVYGKLVLALMILLVGILTIWRKQITFGRLLGTLLLVYTAFYLLGATVHPWYIILPLLLGVFTDFRYPILWSAVVILSYSAYAHPEFRENPGLLFIEYFLVLLGIGYEIRKQRLA